MSLLTSLRQRLRATETTQKTTNAMRLIAMASHNRLQQEKSALNLYTETVEALLHTLLAKSTAHGYQAEEANHPRRELVVIVGSQKGLCGNFNANLVAYFKGHKPSKSTDYDILVIGKQMKEALLYQSIVPVFSFDHFSSHEVTDITDELTKYIVSPLYDAVTLYTSRPKTFFTQTFERITFTKDIFQASSVSLPPEAVSLVQEQSYQDTLNTLGLLAVKARIESLLMDSLLAESSARFLSMDSATRNAEDIMASLKLSYNKLRQATITRELTDLIGSFID